MDQLFVIRDIDYITIGRVFLAFVLGGLVGFERERTQRPAGLRTHMLVAAGAACFTVASIYGFQGLGANSDPARLAAQIITGIGFLGAGAIFRTGDTVKGITTASSIWITAAIGILTGAGMIYLAIFTTVMTWFVLFVLKSIEMRLERRRTDVRNEGQDTDTRAKR
jgi:putative Mg2+ transporter-C (MgtC) family protein